MNTKGGEKTELNDKQQAIMMLFVFILPAFTVWTGLGFPTDRAAIGLLASSVLSGVLVFIKELLGWKPTEAQQ